MAVSVDVPEGLEKEMEEEVRKGRYKSKSELMRDAIRRVLEKQRVDEKISAEMQERLDEAQGSEKVSHSKAKKELQK